MEIVGLIISIIAILLALFTYFKHDIKLKQQADLINQYQIEKINTEKEGSKKAIIQATIEEKDISRRLIKIYNKGKAIAKNVNVIMPNVKGYQAFGNPSPIDIRPETWIEISILLFSNHPDKITIEYNWTDDFKDINEESQVMQLY